VSGQIDISREAIDKAISGDTRAIEQIVRALEGPFFQLARRMMLDPADAEDATQECLLRVLMRLSQYEGQAKFSTWAFRVAVRRILDFREQKYKAPLLTFEAFAADLVQGLEPEAPERAEDVALLTQVKIGCGRALLQALDADHRIVYVLGEIMGLDGEEGADVLEIEPATFRKRLSRARERIRDALSKCCGVVNESAACLCHRRLDRALALGRVAPVRRLEAEGREFGPMRRPVRCAEPPLDLPVLRATIAQIDELERAAAFYRCEPPPALDRDFVAAIRQLLRTVPMS
jgi:RNA polymerase sigma factor (sigma-70 family)